MSYEILNLKHQLLNLQSQLQLHKRLEENADQLIKNGDRIIANQRFELTCIHALNKTLIFLLVAVSLTLAAVLWAGFLSQWM